MGKYWLHNVIDPLKQEFGNKFHIYPDAETRSRSSGGFEAIRGILWHHDADPIGGSDDNVLDYEYVNASDSPIGNFHVQRDGDVWCGAMGASNHAGKGGPVPTSRGTVPLNDGNRYLIGIEASNNGVGESWPDIQLDSYIRLSVVLCRVLGLDPLLDIYGHWTYCEPSCPGRKVDPVGPTPKYPGFGGTSGARSWNMQEVRKTVNARLKNTTPTTPTTPTESDDPDVIKYSEILSTTTAPPVSEVTGGRADRWLNAALLRVALFDATGSDEYDQTAANKLNSLLQRRD